VSVGTREVTGEDLADLLAKYEEMREMRLADAAHPGGDPRRQMAALAARFPGALRELDELPLDAIGDRIDALTRCVRGAASPEPWMLATSLFHRLTRGALAAKRWLGARRGLGAEGFEEAIANHRFAEDARAWSDDLARIASPPAGRLSDLVYERVGLGMGLSPEDARTLVVGRLRRARRG
jgi:hypothetical protein